MDEQDGYNDEQHLIGNLLHEEEGLASVRDGRNMPTHPSHHQLPIEQMPRAGVYWSEPPPPYSAATGEYPWNTTQHPGGSDFFFKSSNGLHGYGNGTRYGNYGQQWAPQQKPMAAVQPFHANEEDLPKSPPNSHSPVSEGRTSDSGTISPEPKAKIKWKKLDLAVGDDSLYANRSNSEFMQPSYKSYSSVAQKYGDYSNHKRVSGSNSVPLSKSSSSIEKALNKSKKLVNPKSRTPPNQPGTPSDASIIKPAKIIGLNPIASGNEQLTLKSHLVTSGISMSSPNIGSNQADDFQKIKRKKKGKNAGQKTELKADSEQKAGSRFLALAQQSQKIDALEDGLTDDDDEEDPEYLRQVEEKKEEMRAKARAELAANNSTDAEKAAKMQKLEIDMKAMFSSKKKPGKNRISHRHRNKKDGYTVAVPEFFKSVVSLLSKAVLWITLFIWNLVCDVAERSMIVAVKFTKSSKGKFGEWINLFFGSLTTIIRRISIEIVDHVKWYTMIDQSPSCQIGLAQNTPFPSCCEDVIERLYSVQNADAYSILGLTKNCLFEEIKLYFDKMTTLLKRDSMSNVGLNEARQLIQNAYDLIFTTAKREDYDSTLEQLPQTFELQRDLDDLRALINTKGAVLHCECGDNHPIIRFHNHRGRYCQKDNGDIWMEKRCFGLVRVFFASINGVIYDITKWCECPNNAIPILRTGLHQPAFRLYKIDGTASCLSNSGTEKHRCSTQRSEGSSDCFIFGNNTSIAIENLCCCNLSFCSIPENIILHNVPCCFGAILAAYNTATSSISGEKSDPDRARRAGRRRRFR